MLPVDAADVPLQRLVLSLDALRVVAGTHVCLRWVRAKRDLRRRWPSTASRICAARPSVMATLLNAPAAESSASLAQGQLHHRRGAAAGSRAGRDEAPTAST